MRTWIAVAALLAASLPAVAQQPEAAAPPPEAVTQAPAAGEQPQPPVFGVGVDVVAVDASVVDGEGRPVLGLGPEDFRVEVDGKPRRLVVGRVRGPRPRAARAAPRPPGALQQQRGRSEGPAGPAAGRSRQHRPGQGPRGGQGRGALPRHAGPRRPCGARVRAGPRAGHRVHPRGRGRPAGPDGSGGHGGPRRIPGAAGRGRLPHPAERPHALAAIPPGAVRRVHVGDQGEASARPTDRSRSRRRGWSSATWSWRTRPRSSTGPTASGPSPPSRPSG